MLTAVGWVVFAALLVPNAVLLIELLLGQTPRPLPLPGAAVPVTVVLMPAHDEAAGIADIVATVIPLLPPGGRLLVVADNCGDDTAARARAAGAEVIERRDPAQRGKGYALAFGRDALAADPPDVVVVLDADCRPEPRAIERLARGAVASRRPVQSAYLIEPRRGGGPMIEISGFAFLVKNLVRQAGLQRLGAPVALTGSGMAFPWDAFAAAPLATADIVEDLAIGIALARAGRAPLFDAQAKTWTAPASESGTLGQRTRWEHGFVATARTTAWPLVREGLARRRPGLMWFGLHLIVPPLALLLMVDVAGLALLALLHVVGMAAAPVLALGLLVGGVLGMVALAWARHGRAQIGAGTLARVPLYLLWKVPIYLKLARGAETRWVRTERDGDDKRR